MKTFTDFLFLLIRRDHCTFCICGKDHKVQGAVYRVRFIEETRKRREKKAKETDKQRNETDLMIFFPSWMICGLVRLFRTTIINRDPRTNPCIDLDYIELP